MITTQVQEVFEKLLPEKLHKQPDKVAKINARYQFTITGHGGGSWLVDLTQPGGHVSPATHGEAQCTVIMSATDFMDLIDGKLNPQKAFITGKLKVEGNRSLALKLGEILR